MTFSFGEYNQSPPESSLYLEDEVEVMVEVEVEVEVEIAYLFPLLLNVIFNLSTLNFTSKKLPAAYAVN